MHRKHQEIGEITYCTHGDLIRTSPVYVINKQFAWWAGHQVLGMEHETARQGVFGILRNHQTEEENGGVVSISCTLSSLLVQTSRFLWSVQDLLLKLQRYSAMCVFWKLKSPIPEHVEFTCPTFTPLPSHPIITQWCI